MEELEQISNVVTPLLKSMVKKPETLTVRVTRSGEDISVQVSATPAEMAVLIGTQGRVARSLRIILQTMGSQIGRQISFNVG